MRHAPGQQAGAGRRGAQHWGRAARKQQLRTPQGSTGDSRAVDLSVYPAKLVGGATVYKTGDATLMGAGPAGTIDNGLVDPLAFRSRVIAANVSKVKTAKGLPAGGSGKRISLSCIDQFADRPIGVAPGCMRVDGISNQLETSSWSGATVQATLATLASGTVVQGVKLPEPFGNGMDSKSRRIDDKRDGLTAILQFKLDKNFNTQLDLFWAKIDSFNKIAHFQGGPGTKITYAAVVNSVTTKGTFAIPIGPAGNGLNARSEGIFDNDKIFSAGWKTNWNVAPSCSASAAVSHNSAKRVTLDA